MGTVLIAERERPMRSSYKASRFLLACLLVPLVIGVIAFVANFCVHEVYSRTPVTLTPQEILASLAYCYVFSLPIAYASEILLGLPVWLIVDRLNFRTTLAYALGGAIVGFLAAQFFQWFLYRDWLDWVEYLLVPIRWLNLHTVTATTGGAIAGWLFKIILGTPQRVVPRYEQNRR